MEIETTLEKLREIGLTESDISSAVEKKQKDYCDLITNADAIYLVAKDNGVKQNKEKQQNTPLVNAKYGRKINCITRLQQASCPKKFKNQKGNGTLVHLTVSDDTKQANVILWNKDAQNFLELKALKNDLLLMENLLVKSENPLELHSTLSTITQLAPIELATLYEEKIPKLAVNLTKLKDLQTTSAEIDTTGIVTSITPPREFEKNNGTETRKITVMRLILNDEDKNVPLVIWNELCEIASKVKKGDLIYVENCAIKPNSYTALTELHTTKNTHLVVKLSRTDQTPLLKINQITQTSTGSLKCEVEKLLEVKTLTLCSKCRKSVKTNCQCGAQVKQVLIATAIVKDETGEIPCTFFEKAAAQLLNIKEHSPETTDALFEFKNQEVKNKKIYIKVTAKQNDFLGKVTLTCKEIENIQENTNQLK